MNRADNAGRPAWGLSDSEDASRPKRDILALRKLWPSFISLRDIGLFVRSARTDMAIGRTRVLHGGRAAFEAAYAATADPWGSASPRYRYQRTKYDAIVSLLPSRPFGRALDLGCGLGLLSQRLATRAGETLGLDVADNAVTLARAHAVDVPRLTFARADLQDLPRSLDGSFDLLVIADTLYYLEPLDDEGLKALVCRMADLVAPGGVCLIANHFFFSADPASRASRRIHDAFSWSPRFTVASQHRRPFFLATLLNAPA